MRILFCSAHVVFWLPLDAVARDLIERGHNIELRVDFVRNRKFEKQFQFDFGKAPYRVGSIIVRTDFWAPIQEVIRYLIDYVAYLKIRQPTSPFLVQRARSYLSLPLRFLTRNQGVNRLLSTRTAWRRLRAIESRIPESRAITEELKRLEPDVVVAASAILPNPREIEYIKAAKALDIPTVIIIPSWDNLTTKSTMPVVPTLVLVWNDRQVKEAVDLHEVPKERIQWTGAPRYDPWFEMKPSLDRRSFCLQAGLDPGRPFVVYVCSSEAVAGDERSFVYEFAKAVAQLSGSESNAVQVLVRPHPQILRYWEGFSWHVKNAVVWPTDLGVIEDFGRMAKDFYHSLFYSLGVVGVNTSAFIEGAVVDRPCLALVSERYHDTQLGIPHFQHLLDFDFLETPRDLGEAARLVSGWAHGEDRKRENRKRFLREFIRPCGLGTPAHKVVADMIEMAGMRQIR